MYRRSAGAARGSEVLATAPQENQISDYIGAEPRTSKTFASAGLEPTGNRNSRTAPLAIESRVRDN